MVHVAQPNINYGQRFGQGLGETIGQRAANEFEYNRNVSRLQKAFQGLQPGSNFVDQLKSIAPSLLSTPGGAQALSELAPVLGSFAKSNAQQQALNNAIKEETATQSPVSRGNQSNVNGNVEGQPPNKFLNPQAPVSSGTTFPERTAGPQPQKEMSPQDIKNLAFKLMQNSIDTGKPILFDEAMNSATQVARNIIDYNSRLQEQKNIEKQAATELSADIVERAKNSNLIKDPEDITVAEKFAREARFAEPGTDQWDYVRTKLRQFDHAKSELTKTYTVPSLDVEAYRRLNGTFKDKERAIKDLQKPLDKFKNLGLYDEALSILTNDIGLGSEDAHNALFPFSKEAQKDLDVFPHNEVKGTTKMGFANTLFPGGFQMNNEQLQEFKDHLADFLKDHPNVDLISLRGNLNQGKNYSWQDISQALDQLIDERRFIPDVEQDKQMTLVRNPPLPGLAQQFKFLLTGTK